MTVRKNLQKVLHKCVFFTIFAVVFEKMGGKYHEVS